MQLGLKIGNTFLVDKIENLNFKEIKEGAQFLIVDNSLEQYDFLKTNINSYVIGTLRNVYCDMIYCFDKNDININLAYELDYDDDDNEIEGSEYISDVYTEVENDNLYYLFFNDKKYILPQSVSFANSITNRSHVMLEPYYSTFFEKGFSFPEEMTICEEDKDIINKSLGYKLNDNLAIIFNIEIKYTRNDKFPTIQKDVDVYFITSDKKYDSISVNYEKFIKLLNFIMENTSDPLDNGKIFLQSLNLFNSHILKYISGEKSKFSLYNEISSLRPYYFLSFEEFNKIFEPFFIDKENNIKCYYGINNRVSYYGDKNVVITKDGNNISSYILEKEHKDIYRCIMSVNKYNQERNCSFNPFTGEIKVDPIYEDYGCKLYYNPNDSWNRNREHGIVPIGKYWVTATDSEIKEALQRKQTMEQLKNCQ